MLKIKPMHIPSIDMDMVLYIFLNLMFLNIEDQFHRYQLIDNIFYLYPNPLLQLIILMVQYVEAYNYHMHLK